MSDEERQANTEESTGGKIQSAITFIKKLPSNTTRIAKGAIKGAIKEMKEDAMKEDTMGEIIETCTEFDVSWQKGNIKAIHRKSKEYRMKDGSEKKAKDIDRDWAASFIDKGKNISDEKMQTMWAKILAGERDNPGTFSKKTLSVLDNMDKKDATLFASFCEYVWLDEIMSPLPIIYDAGGPYDTGSAIYNKRAVNFSALQHLESISLISFRSSWRYYPTPKPAIWYYYGIIAIIFPKNNPQKNNYYIPTGEVLLTQSGKELFQICGAQKNDEFFNYVIDKWQKEGLNPTVLGRNQQSDATTTKKEKM